jgi:hypothetical protein
MSDFRSTDKSMKLSRFAMLLPCKVEPGSLRSTVRKLAIEHKWHQAVAGAAAFQYCASGMFE